MTTSKHLLVPPVWHGLRYEKILPMLWTIHHISVRFDADARLLSPLNFRLYQFGISGLLLGFLVLPESAWIKLNTESPSKMVKFNISFQGKTEPENFQTKLIQISSVFQQQEKKTKKQNREEIRVFLKTWKSTWKILVIVLCCCYYFKPEARLTGKPQRIKSAAT